MLERSDTSISPTTVTNHPSYALFTPHQLGEKLRKQYGEGEGSARLAEDINDVLSEFIMCVYCYGGDIVKFAGDAIICVFLGKQKDRVSDPQRYMEDALLKSRLCAKALINLVSHNGADGLKMHGGGEVSIRACERRNLSRASFTRAPTKPLTRRFALRLLRSSSLAVCWGDIQFLMVGSEGAGPGMAMYMVAGKCVEGAGDALNETTHGQVKIFNSGEIITLDTDFDDTDVADTFHNDLDNMVTRNDKIPTHAIGYISNLCHLRLSHMKHSHFVSTSTDDIRRVSVVFVSLPELELDYNDQNNLTVLNSVFEKIIAITYKVRRGRGRMTMPRAAAELNN